MSKTVLVIGSGAREHAIAERLLESAHVSSVLVSPGNAGTTGSAGGKSLRSVQGQPLEIAREHGVELAVIGPEAPLCSGLADDFRAAGIAVFGPSASASRLEGSKAFMKEFATRHQIPTAPYRIVTATTELEAVVRQFRDPPVVKADGLCGGKGVVVAQTHAEAVEVGSRMLSGEMFGDAGRKLVIEERLPGQEASVHLLADGEGFVLLPVAQDHKRIGDGDTGPNTGGMGAYAPAPLATPELTARIVREILEPAVLGMKAEGTPYRGALFAGLMLTPAGDPKLIEFNVRFGDPETQVMLNTLQGDLFQALLAASTARLSPAALTPSAEHAVCVVIAAAGYPDRPRVGDVVTGIEEAAALEGVRVYHAGTARKDDTLVTSGGRVLGVTGSAPTLVEAHRRAYAGVERIRFEGMQFRRDIAARALGGVQDP